jgi:hypothetical protein
MCMRTISLFCFAIVLIYPPLQGMLRKSLTLPKWYALHKKSIHNFGSDTYDTCKHSNISNIWDGPIHERALSYYSLKKGIDVTYLYQKCYSKALNLPEDRFYEVYPDCLFLTGLWYLIDKKSEEPGTDASNIMSKVEWELMFMKRWLYEMKYDSEPIREHLDTAIKYLKNEQIYVRRTPTEKEWRQMWKWKSSDIRMLGCIVTKFFTGYEQPMPEIRAIIDEIYWFAEAVMDVKDLQKDVEQNALNIYKFYCRWYGHQGGKEKLWLELQDSKKRTLIAIASLKDKQMQQGLHSAGEFWWNQLKELPDMIYDPYDRAQGNL